MDGQARPSVGDEKLFDQRPDLIDQTMFEINSDFGLSVTLEFYSMMAAGGVHCSCLSVPLHQGHILRAKCHTKWIEDPVLDGHGLAGTTLAEIGIPGRTYR